MILLLLLFSFDCGSDFPILIFHNFVFYASHWVGLAQMFVLYFSYDHIEKSELTF